MRLKEVVPWGRSLQEYILMFNLTDADLKKKILGCGDGPASFNTEMTTLGYSVTSIDPIYNFSATEIQQRVEETYPEISQQLNLNKNNYLWTMFQNVEDLCQQRLNTMKLFVEDFPTGLIQDRYKPESLPNLSFSNPKFDLALCSHFLFLYSDQLSLDFHLKSITELLRVANEVRIFPLLTLDCQPSPYLDDILGHFNDAGFNLEIITVGYHLQKNGNQMLRIIKS
jgi:hypothetical protein